MERVKREREREREREKFCVINVKYKEISWRVRRRRRKKVTSRSTEELVLKNREITFKSITVSQIRKKSAFWF